MISLFATLWIMVGFFAVIDMQRGWTRAVIATSGLVLSLFAIDLFMPRVFSAFGMYDQVFDDTIWRRQILILTGIQLVIGFFAYAGPAFTGRLSGRLAIRDNIQDKFLGLLVGALNGYLAVGTIMAFLQWRVLEDGTWVKTEPAAYPFSTEIIDRAASTTLDAFSQWLPINLLTDNPVVLPVLMVLVFLFVLIVML